MKFEEEKWMEKRKKIRSGCLFGVDSVGLLSMEKKGNMRGNYTI